ncbi:PDZ domain-containing protein [Chitinophaga sp. MM2321]|uniref:PDZ domain-containing protein n=1 Tax=Chitinophaga sp. MM2321 TaxID=3137178 RepID=UPI0032D573AB
MKKYYTTILFLVALLLQTVLVPAQQKNNDKLILVQPGERTRNLNSLPTTVVMKQLPTVIRHYRAMNPDKNIVVKFAPGTYYPDSTWVLTPEDNNGDAHITFSSSNKNIPATISGGKKVAVTWTLWKDGIYKAQLDLPFTFDQLYINDEQQIRARYPNYDSSARHYNGTAADAISPEKVKTWQHPEGGYVHALHKAEWGGYHYRITGVNADYTLQLEGGYQNNRQMGMHDQYRFVENIFEELDTVKEWYYNNSTKTLYYKPGNNTDLKKATVVVSRLPQVIALKGSTDNPVRNISFEGIRFAHTAPTFMDTREPLLRSDWAIYRGGAVVLDGTENCSIKDCEFDHNGGNAIFVSNYNRGAMISGCHIHDAGGSGICFVGNPEAVRSPLFEYNKSLPLAAIDTVTGPKSRHYPDSCTAYNNLIHSIGRIEKQTAGVQISMAMDITVSHNTIYDVPRAGINVSEGTWGGHLIEYNDVFNTVLETGDHGAFNSWGRDRYWRPSRHEMDSIVAIHPWLVKLDAIKTTTLRNNRFRCDHGWDIDLDDGSSNYHIYNNVCLNGGLKLREGFYRTVENNIILNNSFHPHVWFANSHDIFRHNIVTAAYKPIGITYWGEEVDYNFFPDKAAIVPPTDVHAVSGNPMFIQPATGDYRVSPSSPALQTGFKNFPMNEFGVVSPALKRIAKKAPLPVLKQQAILESAVISWQGAKVKNITTLGERSAAGLPDNNGAYFIAVPTNFRYDIQAGDVVLQVGDKAVKNVAEMIKAFEAQGNTHVSIIVFRNQQQKKLD